MKILDRLSKLQTNIKPILIQPVYGLKHAQEKSSVEWNVRVKDLRHFFDSTMLNRGFDSLEIANQMGHQDINMLGERYGHYTDEKLDNSSKVWDYTEKKSQIGANSKSFKITHY